MNDRGYSKFEYTVEKRKSKINNNKCAAFSCSSNDKTCFICFYFYLTLSLANYGQKKYENCKLISISCMQIAKHAKYNYNLFIGSHNVTIFFSRDFRNQLFAIKWNWYSKFFVHSYVRNVIITIVKPGRRMSQINSCKIESCRPTCLSLRPLCKKSESEDWLFTVRYLWMCAAIFSNCHISVLK